MPMKPDVETHLAEIAARMTAPQPDDIRFLLGEVETMRAWAERAAADENANAAELAQARADLVRAHTDGARAMHTAVKRALIVEDDEEPGDWIDAREKVRALNPAGVVAHKRQGVYVASRASIPERSAMWRQLRREGLPITSTWIDEAGPGESFMPELWRRIPQQISESAMLIIYVDPADLPLRGAFVEVGMALALGLRVFVAAPGVEIPALGSWIWSPGVTLCANLEDAVRQARSLIDAMENA